MSEQGASSSDIIVLVGPPGAGKSTVGRAVAQRLGVAFTDTDDEIARTAGKSISDIFVEDGEAAFRALEREQVLAAVADHRGVLALGGGSVLDEHVQAVLADLAVVYLEVGIADASGRVGFDTARPLLAVNPRASWVRLMESRRPIYEAVATTRIDTAGRTVDEVISAVVGAVQQLSGSERGDR